MMHHTHDQAAVTMDRLAEPAQLRNTCTSPFVPEGSPLPDQSFYRKVSQLIAEIEKGHWKNHVYSPEEVLL